MWSDQVSNPGPLAHESDALPTGLCFWLKTYVKMVVNICEISVFEILRMYMYHISSVIRQSFPFQNNPKDLDPSCKMELDLWDCLGREKLVL